MCGRHVCRVRRDPGDQLGRRSSKRVANEGEKVGLLGVRNVMHRLGRRKIKSIDGEIGESIRQGVIENDRVVGSSG